MYKQNLDSRNTIQPSLGNALALRGFRVFVQTSEVVSRVRLGKMCKDKVFENSGSRIIKQNKACTSKIGEEGVWKLSMLCTRSLSMFSTLQTVV